LLWALAIETASWLLFGLGLLLFLSSIVSNDARGILRWFTSTRLALGIATMVAIVLLGGLLSLAGLSAPGSGRGLTLQIGSLMVTLLVLLAVATAAAIVWITAWRAMGQDPPEWAVYAFGTALAVFAVGFMLIPWAVAAESPDAYDLRSKIQMALMAASAAGAAAVPPLVRRGSGSLPADTDPVATPDYR
jgi:hypothetical protein